MTKKLWQASLNQKKNSNLFAFEKYVSKKFNKKFNNDFQKQINLNFFLQLEEVAKVLCSFY